MKKLAFLLLLPLCGMYSQSKSIPTGVYKSNMKGQDFLMRLNDDRTYEMVFLHGKYEEENDTIRFINKKQHESSFEITPLKREASATTLTVKFKEASVLYASNVYVGVQENDSRPPEYKRVTEYMKGNRWDRKDELMFRIDKTKYLYFVQRKGKGSIVSKFEIDSDISEIMVDFTFDSLLNMKFLAYMDADNNLVMTDGRSPVLFTFEKAGAPEEKKEIIQPIEVKTDKEWAKNAGIEDYSEFYQDEYTPVTNFKYKIEKTFAEALKATSKFPGKFLVVAVDYNNKKRDNDFNAFIKDAEEQMRNSMGDEENDHFNFYLASDKDKNLLTKNNVDITAPKMVVFNPEGDLIYKTNGTPATHLDYFQLYSSIFPELQQANEYLKFDRVIQKKTSTLTDIKKSFKDIQKVSTNYSDTDSTGMTYENDVIAEETIPVVDTVAVAYESDYRYNDFIRDKENLYSLKTTRETVNSKWSQIMAFYKKNNIYDEDYINIGLNELNDKGFTEKLFNIHEDKLNDTGFDFLDYVFSHSEEINRSAPKTMENIYGDNRNSVNFLLGSFFKKNMRIYDSEHRPSEKFIQYYKKYMDFSGDNFEALRMYLAFLERNENSANQKEYIETYEKYFRAIIKENSNVIEDLDRAFSKTGDDMGWQSFKSSFASMANEIAWGLVEKRAEKQYIQKAVVWSETSLKIEPESPYFMDTLAQLYYLSGDRQKGIKTEEIAVKLAEKSIDKDMVLRYQEVVEKMKSGTY